MARNNNPVQQAVQQPRNNARVMNSERLLKVSAQRFDGFRVGLGENHAADDAVDAIKDLVQQRLEVLDDSIRAIHDQIQRLAVGQSQANFDAALAATLNHFINSEVQFYQNMVTQATRLGLNDAQLKDLREIIQEAQRNERSHIQYVQNLSKNILKTRMSEYFVRTANEKKKLLENYRTEQNEDTDIADDDIELEVGDRPVKNYDRKNPKLTSESSSAIGIVFKATPGYRETKVKIGNDGTVTVTFAYYGFKRAKVQKALDAIIADRLTKGWNKLDLSGIPYHRGMIATGINWLARKLSGKNAFKTYVENCYYTGRKLGIAHDKITLPEGFLITDAMRAKGDELRAKYKADVHIIDDQTFDAVTAGDLNELDIDLTGDNFDVENYADVYDSEDEYEADYSYEDGNEDSVEVAAVVISEDENEDSEEELESVLNSETDESEFQATADSTSESQTPHANGNPHMHFQTKPRSKSLPDSLLSMATKTALEKDDAENTSTDSLKQTASPL